MSTSTTMRRGAISPKRKTEPTALEGIPVAPQPTPARRELVTATPTPTALGIFVVAATIVKGRDLRNLMTAATEKVSIS